MKAVAADKGSGVFFLETLGQLCLRAATGEQLVGPRKELVLLAYIARRAPRPVRRAELAALMWDEHRESHARQSLRQAVLRLKRELGECLVVGADQLSLLPNTVELDAALFEKELAGGRIADGVRRWGGDFLSGAEDAGGAAFRLWLEAEREGLRKRLAWAFERLVRDAEGRGERAAALGWAERWAELFPLDERAHGRVVELLRSAGRAEDALARHARFVVQIRDDVGRDPSPEIQRLGVVLERELRAPRIRSGNGGSPSPFSPDLVGRAAALDLLGEAWSAARMGIPQVVLVEGEEGIGKSRLCEEFLSLVSARSPGAVVLCARAHEARRDAEGTVAHELLAPLADAPGLLGVSPQALADLACLVPEVRERVRELPEPSRDAWASGDALSLVLEAVSEEEPVLVFVDDLPRADELTQRLIISALTRATRARLMVLVSARSDELRGWTMADRLLSSHDGVPTRRVRLEPLLRADVERLVASMLELSDVDLNELAGRIYDETGGNPFFATEIVAGLAKEGHVTRTAEGTWLLAPALAKRPLPHPPAVSAAVDRSLSCLGADARRLIRSAAMVGGSFDLQTAATAAGLTAAALYPALDELVGRRLIREVDAGSGRYEFTHDLMHRAIRDDVPHTPRRATSARWLRLAAITVTMVVVLLAAVGVFTRRGHELLAGRAPVVIAVAPITEFPNTDSAQVGSAVADMLSTNLARAPGLQVVGNARIYDLLGDVGADGSRPTLIHVAKVAGASELLEGALHRRGGGVLRLDLRRVDLESGVVQQAFAVEGKDAFALVDSATTLIAASLRIPAGPLRIADVTTSSLIAYRLYGEGLRAYYQQSDVRTAEQLFSAALAEDSSFAMAAYYQAILSPFVGGPMFERLVSASKKAEHASERERLIIQSTAAFELNNPEAIAIAETLATRYPSDPSGHYLVGHLKVGQGDFFGAIPHLARTVDMDSLAFRGSAVSCRACDAMYDMTDAYWKADSLPAAERVARQWVRRQPGSATAWRLLASLLRQEGRYAEAIPIADTVARLSPGQVGDLRLENATLAIRDGKFAQADRLLGELIREGSTRDIGEPLWFLAISLRTQGRLRDALKAARRVRALSEDTTARIRITQVALAEAQALFEAGHPRAAAALFDSLMVLATNPERPEMRWRDARGKTWFLTHVATARAAAGDTAALQSLADSIEVAGRQSGYGRDRLLHHHVRGLLAVARGQLTQAEQEFRSAIYSPTLGYTRTNLELARVLLALQRPREAASILQPALRGSLEASNMYVTRTELHEVLAQAFDQAGERDSAATHYREVVSAWRAADAPFRSRVVAAQRRLTALSGRAP